MTGRFGQSIPRHCCGFSLSVQNLVQSFSLRRFRISKSIQCNVQKQKCCNQNSCRGILILNGFLYSLRLWSIEFIHFFVPTTGLEIYERCEILGGSSTLPLMRQRALYKTINAAKSRPLKKNANISGRGLHTVPALPIRSQSSHRFVQPWIFFFF